MPEMLDLHDREKGTAASCIMNSERHSGTPPANGSGFSVGEKVRYWSQKHYRWVDAHVQRINRGPCGSIISYDLTAKAQAEVFKVRDASTPADAPAPPPPFERKAAPDEAAADLAPPVLQKRAAGPPEGFVAGERVEYWSTSAGRWVAATVLRLDAEAGQCDLDLKPGAPLSRVRKAASYAAAARPGAAQAGGEATAWPSAGPKSARIAPPPPLSCGFKVGDQVQYWSETKTRWLEAVVQGIGEKEGSVVYDLDCKKGTPADRVRPSLVASLNRYQVGEDVEYWSTSAGRWLPAKVLCLYTHLGQCDLDVKPGAPLGRLRPVVAGSVAPELPRADDRQVSPTVALEPPRADDRQMSPTSSAEPRRHQGAAGPDGGECQRLGSDPLQLNQLLKESAAGVPPRKPPPCVGEWCNGSKTMRVSESGERLVVDMGPLTPTLVLVPTGPDDRAWPKEWAAVRKSSSGRPTDAKHALYILELPEPTSERLFVKRPVGDGQVEFVRVCSEESAAKPNPQSGSDGPSDPSPPSRARSRSPRRR